MTVQSRCDTGMSKVMCRTGGMSGILLVASDEPCPTVLPAPYKLGDDITANGVVCANFY